MAIFTSAAVATFLGLAEATFFTGAVATALNIGVGVAASMGLSYAAKAIAGDPAQATKTDNFGIQGTLQAGGEVPRSFNVGYNVTGGSLVYANYHGGSSATPNAYMTQVIALSDLPSGPLKEFWVNNEKMTLPVGGLVGGAQGSDAGYTPPEYVKPRGDAGTIASHLWIKYYDGTQTIADPYLVGTVASVDRPYESTRVGVGIAYVVVTYLENDKLWTGFPEFKFAGVAVKLYDPSRDSTNSGSGSHRYANPTTWGGDGDDLPAVQIYNILRGFHYNGSWLYGLQNFAAARLPASNWIAQINKCRAVITGESGNEATYRSGGQININTQPVNAIESLLTTCQGRLSEIGGFYKLHLGTPDASSFSFSDDNILSSEPQSYRPFFALSDSINGIQGSYPDPDQGWENVPAPALYRTDLETLDGNRRLMANPSFDFVPYRAQVQRLQKSAIEEAQRARTHTIVLPQEFCELEPGDYGPWTSVRNGYTSKLFRVDGLVDKSNLDIIATITEVDPSDYDWNHSTEFQPNTASDGIIVSRPDAQGVIDWSVESWTLPDSSGIGRRPAIRLSWDGTVPGVVGVQYEVRLASDQSHVTRGRTDQLAVGAIIVSQSLIPDEDYEVHGQYLPSSPREMLWSDWLPVTTPDVRLSISDIDDGIRHNLTTLQNQFKDKLSGLETQFSRAIAQLAARHNINKEILNQQSWDHRVDLISRIAVGDDALGASIEDVRTVAINTENAFAAYQVTVDAHLGTIDSSITTNATAISTLSSSFASYQVTVAAQFGTTNANVTTNASAIATLNSSFSSYTTTVNAHLGTLDSSVTTNATAIAGVGAQITVDVTVDGYVRGTKLINGGAGLSAFVVQADKLEFQLPGYNGNAPISALIVGTIAGAAAFGFSGNMFLDGTLNARAVVAGTITGTMMVAQTVNTTQLAINGVDILNIVQGAATQLYVDIIPTHNTAVSGTAYLLGSGAISTNVPVTHNIQGGNAVCVINMTEVNWGGGNGTIALMVDGGVVNSWALTGDYGFTFMWVAAGLSAGNHTFQIRLGTVGGTGASWLNGQLNTIDLRR